MFKIKEDSTLERLIGYAIYVVVCFLMYYLSRAAFFWAITE